MSSRRGGHGALSVVLLDNGEALKTLEGYREPLDRAEVLEKIDVRRKQRARFVLVCNFISGVHELRDFKRGVVT